MDANAAAGRELDAVRARRAELRSSITFLEIALAAPASGRSVVWGETVHDALAAVSDEWVAHLEVTEGADGLHRAVQSANVRMTNAIDRLTAEHVTLSAEIAGLVDDSHPPVSGDDVDALRVRATALLSHLSRHRQRGADLVYEAYQCDIGGAD